MEDVNVLTAEKIAEKADKFNGRANITEINRLYRVQDESHLYPINNEFNVTERAIRRLRSQLKDYGAIYGLEYSYALDRLICAYVNSN